ncbi:MAG TPA: DMT family transporter [Candidatus Dormibacteraeota bacterium]|jgi:drug/metabolite transporter (DMT)-like permease|nr:DMT family transporter [Candidatus Dormibacteraeota bacterium]
MAELQATPAATAARLDWRPVALGLTGVLVFSLTLPATKLALVSMSPIFIGLGRAVVAGAPAAVALAVTRQRLPRADQWRRLLVVAVGVVVGFPLCSALALGHLSSAHGAVVVGLLPLSTACFAVLRAGERPSRRFWVACSAGSALVVAFALSQGLGGDSAWDGMLVLAVLLGGLGYAEGAVLARELGGWQVICWALVLAAPFLLVPVALAAPQHGVDAPAWLGFAYVSLGSMFLGFFAWYRAMAMAGVARISQLQLLQPPLTLVWSALLLGDGVGPLTVAAGLGVIVCVAAAQRSR